MNKIKSVPSFIRKQLKIKGATEHSGRGFHVMSFDCTATELMDTVVAKLEKWKKQGIVEHSITTVAGLRIEFKVSACESEYYRTVVFSFGHTTASVMF